MGDTTISWTYRPGTRGRSWNPVQGCAMVSPGCKNCYAMKTARRFANGGWSTGLVNPKTGKWTGELRVAEHKLLEPLGWREPSTVFVNSMSDLFAFSNAQIAAVFGIMAESPQHTYIIATKRSREMRGWFEWVRAQRPELPIQTQATPEVHTCIEHAIMALPEQDLGRFTQRREGGTPTWPLLNVWLLVSVENQDYVWRIEDLMSTPAAICGVSLEPLLGPIELGGARLDWVIAGCESGPVADRRPTHSDWLRSLRRQCRDAGRPFFLKQACDRDPGGGISGYPGDRRSGGIFEPPALDGDYSQAFPIV